MALDQMYNYDYMVLAFYVWSLSPFRTKTRILERGVDMRVRVKVVLHFVGIMKVHVHINTFFFIIHTHTHTFLYSSIVKMKVY